jgi:hypothetical protein
MVAPPVIAPVVVPPVVPPVVAPALVPVEAHACCGKHELTGTTTDTGL